MHRDIGRYYPLALLCAYAVGAFKDEQTKRQDILLCRRWGSCSGVPARVAACVFAQHNSKITCALAYASPSQAAFSLPWHDARDAVVGHI